MNARKKEKMTRSWNMHFIHELSGYSWFTVAFSSATDSSHNVKHRAPMFRRHFRFSGSEGDDWYFWINIPIPIRLNSKRMRVTDTSIIRKSSGGKFKLVMLKMIFPFFCKLGILWCDYERGLQLRSSTPNQWFLDIMIHSVFEKLLFSSLGSTFPPVCSAYSPSLSRSCPLRWSPPMNVFFLRFRSFWLTLSVPHRSGSHWSPNAMNPMNPPLD